MSVACCKIKLTKKRKFMSNINKSNEIILAITESVKQETNYNDDRASNLAYAKAFGFAWGILKSDQREMMLEYYLGTEKALDI
jgi:hypothetical protein